MLENNIQNKSGKLQSSPLLNNVRRFDHVTDIALFLSVTGGWTWWRTVVPIWKTPFSSWRINKIIWVWLWYSVLIFEKLLKNNSRLAYELSLSQFLNESGALKNTCVNCEVCKWKQAEGKITLRCTGCKVQGAQGARSYSTAAGSARRSTGRQLTDSIARSWRSRGQYSPTQPLCKNSRLSSSLSWSSSQHQAIPALWRDWPSWCMEW